jgi:hypothetical protein
MSITHGLQELIVVDEAQMSRIKAKGTPIESEEKRIWWLHAGAPLGRALLRAARTMFPMRESSAAKTEWPSLVMR